MPNLATVLKDEISRLARKEVRSQTEKIKRASTLHRRDIAAMKRQITQLERQVALLGGKVLGAPATPDTEEENGTRLRFTPKGLRSQRKRLGLSAGDYALLVGVTPQSIYNWERASSRPRKGQIATLAALRGIGKKEALARIKQLTAS